MNEYWKHINRVSSCPEFNELELYHAKKLDKEKRFAVENHLADCGLCRDYLDGLSVLPENSDLNSIEKNLKRRVHQLLYPEKKNRLFSNRFQKLSVAASILLVLSISVFLMLRVDKHPVQITEKSRTETTLPAAVPDTTDANHKVDYQNEIAPSVNLVIAQNLSEKEVGEEKVPRVDELAVPEKELNKKTISPAINNLGNQEKEKETNSEKPKIQIRGAASVSANNYAYGKVIDGNGEPLPGATVYNPKQKDGVVTNVDGYFIVPAQPGDSLQIVFVGFDKEDVVVEPQKELNVKMQPSALALEEVVVVGYGAQKKRELMGSVASSTVRANKFQRLIHPEWRKVKKLEMRYSALPDSMKNDWSNSKKEAIKYSYYKNEYMTLQYLEKLQKISQGEQELNAIQKAIDAVNAGKYRKARRIIQSLGFMGTKE